jgi:hypothetical protein
MNQLFPKKDPEAAKTLLETPDEKLMNIDREKKFILAVAMTPMPCPMCFSKVSVVETADDTLAVGDGYSGKYVCPTCETELAKVVPFFMVPGTPGWHWQRKYAIRGKTEGDRVFSRREFELLVEEHDALMDILHDAAARGRRRDPPVINASAHKELQLVMPARLATYLERGGWRIDEGGTDDIHRTWEKAGGGVCVTHAIPVADAEVMAWDVESVALGEGCSVLRVVVGLLALGPVE